MEIYIEVPDIETSSDSYAGRFAGDVGDWFLKLQENITLKMLADMPGARVLDVGGGHGQVTQALIDAGHHVTVVGSADVCCQRIQHFVDRGQCDFKVSNLLKLDFPDKSFDVVLSYRLLPHINQWPILVKELSRVAAKAVIVDFPEHDSVNVIAPSLFKFKKAAEGNTRPFTLFKRAELLTAFGDQNFAYAAHTPQFFFPMVLHRKLKHVGLSKALERLAARCGLTARYGSPVILKLTRQA